MHPLLLPLMLAGPKAGIVPVFSAPSTISRTARENLNGDDTVGLLIVRLDGSLDWIGDDDGISVNDSWWSPEGSPVGDWWVRLNFVSGTNQWYFTSPNDLGVWYKVAGSGAAQVTWRFRKAPSGSSGGTTDGVYNLLFSQDGGSSTYHTCSVNDITLFEPTI